MILEKILELEELEALVYIDTSVCDVKQKEIVDCILTGGGISASLISQKLSLDHAILYMEMCNHYKKDEINQSIHDHNIKCQNQE